jgi:hypothetical protein
VAVIGIAVTEVLQWATGGKLLGFKGSLMGAEWKHWFGSGHGVPGEGKIDPEELEGARKRSEEFSGRVTKSDELAKEMRAAQREYFTSIGREKDYNRYDLKEARAEVVAADRAWDAGHEDSSKQKGLAEQRIAANEHLAETQGRIAQLQKETTRELQSQLDKQREQISLAEKQAGQENARFGRLSAADRQAITRIGKKIQQGQAPNEIEMRYLDKKGFGKAVTDKYFADKVTADQQSVLGTLNGIAPNALAEMRAQADKLQKMVEGSAQSEKEDQAQRRDTRARGNALKGATLPPAMQPKTELPRLDGEPAEMEFETDAAGRKIRKGRAPQPNAEPQNGAQGPAPHRQECTTGDKDAQQGQGQDGPAPDGLQQASVKFEREFEAVLERCLLPAIEDGLRRLAARINNASSIG